MALSQWQGAFDHVIHESFPLMKLFETITKKQALSVNVPNPARYGIMRKVGEKTGYPIKSRLLFGTSLRQLNPKILE